MNQVKNLFDQQKQAKDIADKRELAEKERADAKRSIQRELEKKKGGKVKELSEAYDLVRVLRKDESFHDDMAKDFKLHPEEYSKFSISVEKGKSDKKKIMNSFRDFKSPDHEKSLEIVRNKYNYDEDRLEKDCINKWLDATQAVQVEFQDASYENRILNGYVPSTNNDVAVMDKFRSFIKNKWKAAGYNSTPGHSDSQVIANFWAENKQPPLNRAITDSSIPRTHDRTGLSSAAADKMKALREKIKV
jgi:hypothetical protein